MGDTEEAVALYTRTNSALNGTMSGDAANENDVATSDVATSDVATCLGQLLRSHVVHVALLPEKKGRLVKHAEYNVSSETYRSQVIRRFSDFLLLNDLLLQQYQYRLVPRIPPKAATAFYTGLDSEFADTRRRALQRWITLVCAHPVLAKDKMVEYFLTYMGEDHATKLRDNYKNYPDEFLSHNRGYAARDDNSLEIAAQVTKGRAQVAVITQVVVKAVNILDRIVERSGKTSADLGEFGRELTSLTNESYLPPKDSPGQGWAALQTTLFSITKHFTNLSSQWAERAQAEDKEVANSMRLLQDVVLGYKDLCDRVDKQLPADHKRSLERIASIKRRKLTGILASDPGVLQGFANKVEDYEIAYTSLEVRQAFSTLCMEKETQLAFLYTEVLGDVVACLSRVEVAGETKILEIWQDIRQVVKDLEMKRKK